MPVQPGISFAFNRNRYAIAWRLHEVNSAAQILLFISRQRLNVLNPFPLHYKGEKNLCLN
jgi:hypothetical protein